MATNELICLFIKNIDHHSFMGYLKVRNTGVVSLAEIITNVDEVDFIMFNSISNPILKSNKNNLDVVQLAAMVKVISC